jgi:methyl-accepting chemotaxis protein
LKSLQLKMVLIFSSLFLLSSVILSVNVFYNSTKLVTSSVGTQAKDIADRAMKMIDLDKYSTIKPEEGPNEYYNQLRLQFNELKETNGVQYLFTMARKETNSGFEYYYVVDGYPLNSEEASSLGEVEENHYSHLIESFEKKQTVIGELSYDKEYGALITAYVPIIDKSGNMLGVVGVDLDATSVYELLQKETRNQIIVTAIILAIGLLAIFILSRYLIKPLQILNGKIEELRKGDFTISLETNRKDEIGKLTTSFAHMVEDLKVMISGISSSSQHLTSSSDFLVESSNQATESADILTLTINQLTEGARRQKHIISETSTSINEVATGVEIITDHLESVVQFSIEANNVSIRGQKQIQEAIAQINLVKEAQATSAVVIRELGEKTKAIDEIVLVITDIANQTNLLALNAAIEAARAGEHGRGFSVVSQEVRKLAEDSGKAAEKISLLITDIQAKTALAMEKMNTSTVEVENGTKAVSESGDAFTEIFTAVKDLSNKIESITNSAEEIASISNQVVTNIREVGSISTESSEATEKFADHVTNQVAMVQGINSSTDQLRRMSEQLYNLIKQFKTE